MVSFLQARMSSSIGLLLLVFCCKTRKKTKKLSAPSRFRRKGEKKGRWGPTGWEIPFKGHHFKISTAIRVLKSKITPLDLSQYSFRVLSLKKKCQEVLELAPRKGKNSLGPRPSNEILVSLRAFVENFNFLWEFSPGEGGFERAGRQSAECDTKPSHGYIWIRSSLISTPSPFQLISFERYVCK